MVADMKKELDSNSFIAMPAPASAWAFPAMATGGISTFLVWFFWVGRFSLQGPLVHWLMEDLIRFGDIRMGLPGLASLALFASPLLETIPRIFREKDVGKLPLLPFSAMAVNSTLWGTYGLLGNIPAVWCPNVGGFSLGIFYTAVYLSYSPKGANWLPFSAPVHVGAFVANACLCFGASQFLQEQSAIALLGAVGNVANVVLFAGPLAAIKTVLKEQSTRSLPFGFTCAVLLNCFLWTFYGVLLLGDPNIYVANSIGMLLGLGQLSLFAMYGLSSSGAGSTSLETLGDFPSQSLTKESKCSV